MLGEGGGREEGARVVRVVEGGEAVEGVAGVVERVGWWVSFGIGEGSWSL